VIVEFGDSGSGTAAPLAAQIAEYYLNKKHGFRNPELVPESIAARVAR